MVLEKTSPRVSVDGAEVNISSYPATLVAGLFFHSRAVNSNQGVSCRNIGQEQLRVKKLTIWIQLKWSLKS